MNPDKTLWLRPPPDNQLSIARVAERPHIPPMDEPMRVFDRHAVRRHRARAAADLAAHDFLLCDVAERLIDRLQDISRTFPLALDLGCHTGEIGRMLGRHGGIDTLVQCDLSPEMAHRAGEYAVAADEEALPFAPAAFDLVLSSLSLHWVNDLPGSLLQIRQTLKPDGLFLAALFGGGTLVELRNCLMEAESEIVGGVSPRVSPFADLRDAAGLLQRAGFTLPVADRDTVTVTYENAFKLFADLRGMGEGNAIQERQRRFTRRTILLRAAELYQSRHAQPDGRIDATFNVIFMHGWAPHPSQQAPLRPGSAQSRLATALETEEVPAGDKATPKPTTAKET